MLHWMDSANYSPVQWVRVYLSIRAQNQCGVFLIWSLVVNFIQSTECIVRWDRMKPSAFFDAFARPPCDHWAMAVFTNANESLSLSLLCRKLLVNLFSFCVGNRNYIRLERKNWYEAVSILSEWGWVKLVWFYFHWDFWWFN